MIGNQKPGKGKEKIYAQITVFKNMMQKGVNLVV
jgi:hypothetical protein